MTFERPSVYTPGIDFKFRNLELDVCFDSLNGSRLNYASVPRKILKNPYLRITSFLYILVSKLDIHFKKGLIFQYYTMNEKYLSFYLILHWNVY